MSVSLPVIAGSRSNGFQSFSYLEKVFPVIAGSRSNGFQRADHERPFLFHMDRYGIYFWNHSTDTPRKVYGFLTRNDIEFDSTKA